MVKSQYPRQFHNVLSTVDYSTTIFHISLLQHIQNLYFLVMLLKLLYLPC